MGGIVEKLKGGDLRSIGSAGEVAALIEKEPRLFRAVFSAMRHGDAVVRARAADACEKASRNRPELLFPFKKEMAGMFSGVEQREVRWHLCQMATRLKTTRREKRKIASVLAAWLEGEKSRIVKTFAMQALADLAARDATLAPEAREIIARHAVAGSPAMRARGRKLLKEMGKR